jgi:hypothetical protein
VQKAQKKVKKSWGGKRCTFGCAKGSKQEQKGHFISLHLLPNAPFALF